MRRIVVIWVLVLNYFSLYSKDTLENLISGLDREVEKKEEYAIAKWDKITKITNELNLVDKSDLDKRFNLYNQLYQESQSFNFDTAFSYAEKMLKIAYKKREYNKIALSKIDISFLLVTSGMFHEALDTLKTIKTKSLPDSILYAYYNTKARLYMDNAGYYIDKRYSVRYDTIANRLLDSALRLCDKNSTDYYYNLGLKYLKNNKFDIAYDLLQKITIDSKSDPHLFAKRTSCLAYISLKKGDTLSASQLLIEAAKADIMASVKENVALVNLAEILYKKGYVKKSYHYIKMALNDANFYGSRYRKRQILSILPIIESQELLDTEQQKKNYIWSSFVLGVFSFLVITLLFIILIHFRKLKRAKAEIYTSNCKLLEANNIKEEYIGNFFNTISEYIDKIDKFKKALNRKVAVKRIEDIELIINNIDPVKERENLYENFDRTFLKLFPMFIKDFNALLKEEERIELKENTLLNTDLRIYALIRLGINDNEKIARILGLSVYTIYNYKTKMRNKSIIPNDLFEKKVMEIKAV